MRNKIIDKLKQDIINFEKEIYNNKVIRNYPILPIQLISILANYKSKIFKIKFSTYVDIGRLEEIILQFIRNNDIYRSSIISREGKLFIQEHEPPGKIQLPILDFSFHTDKEREEIINKIFKCKSINKLGTKHFFIKFLAYKNLFLVLKHLYTKNKTYKLINILLSIPLFNNYDPSYKNALGKFILVKINFKEYILILYLDHLVLDNLSVSLLIEEIENSYYANTYCNNERLSYSSLSSQLSLGPKIKDPDIIIDKLKLKEYFYASQKIKKELSHSDYYLLRYSAKINDAYHDELIEVSIFISAIICSKVFHINKIPITLLYGNRKYQTCNYYNTIGLFQDFVPLLIDLEKIDYRLHKIDVNNYLNFLSENNLNILYIIFNKYNDKNWLRLINLINLETVITSDPQITLNIEFDHEKRGYTFNEKPNESLAENNQITISKTHDKALIKNLQKKGGIIFWVDISKNSIRFQLESLFPIESHLLNTLTKELEEFIL